MSIHQIIYIPDIEHINRFDSKTLKEHGLEYLKNPDEIRRKIEREYQFFGFCNDEHNNCLFYYQHPINHCIARIGKRRLIKSHPVFSIKFSFVEKQVLEQTLRDLGLPVSNIKSN